MSENFSIDNAAYWKAVKESTDGYALEHTFVIHYRINLPIILNGTNK
jgi:hypothetical protein